MTSTNKPILNGKAEGTPNENVEDVESKTKQLPFPKSIAFIASNEFCERFMYNGMRAILVLYLTRELLYDDDTATIVYHSFIVLIYFLGVFGAIISDSWLGKFKTILYLSIVYAIGGLVIAVGAVPPANLPAPEMTILGLVLIAVGSGGIKPCVTAFGGDQFKLPEQIAQLSTYFTIFYFSINMGSFLSGLITPILRHDVSCFDSDNCFSLAFGVPSILMIMSIVIFCVGKCLYIIKPPSGNMVVLVSKCIGSAISTKIKSLSNTKKAHWLDFAEEKFDQQLINDIKVLLRVLVLYFPLPLFWALFDQKGSRWTFQATRMNGDLGFIDIKPDQMQVINPFLIIIFLPLADIVIYPIISKLGIRRPLQKLALGGILAGVAFIISGIVELELQKTYPVLPEVGEGQLRFFNTHPCDYNFQTDIPNHEHFILKSMETFEDKHIAVNSSHQFNYRIFPDDSSIDPLKCPEFNGNFNLKSKTSMSYFIQSNNIVEYEDNPGKSKTGDPMIRLIINIHSQHELYIKDQNGLIRYSGDTSKRELIQLVISTYIVYIGNIKVAEIKMEQGGVYTLLIMQNESNTISTRIYDMAAANSMHILWMLPQYVVMTLGEIMYAVTGLAFTYSQAPVSMKAVVQACWLLTICFGNVIAVIVVGAKIFDSQASEFFLFAGLMFVDMCIFMLLAWRYKGVPQNSVEGNLLSEGKVLSQNTKDLK